MGKTKDLTKQLLTKMLGLAAMVTVALFMFSSISLHADAATAKVTASSVRIRKEASTTSEVVSSANSGDSFTIQSEVTGADGYVWYQISVDGQTGYIRSDLAQKSEDGSAGTTTPSVSNPSVTQVQPISAKVTGGQVRVRPDASTNGSVVTTVAQDTVVTVNGTAEGSDGRTWYSVSFRSGNEDVSGFIREDFLELAGELVPVVDVTPEVPSVEEPADVPEAPVEVKDYETFEEDDKWYLVNNTTSPAYQYVIEDIFSAAETNAKLYEDSLKTIKTQKVFIVILVLLLVAGGIGATLVIFKMKDMLDEAYFEEVEKEVANRRQNKQQNVMHTVGKDAVQRKPTVNGQQRPATKSQSVSGQPKQMPKQQANMSQPKPNMTAQSAGSQPKQAQRPQQSMQQRPAGNANPATAQKQAVTQQKPAASQQKPVSASNQTAQQKPAAQPQANAVTKNTNNVKPNQEWKSKNFMSDDDDDFEYDFLNWDGDEEI